MLAHVVQPFDRKRQRERHREGLTLPDRIPSSESLNSLAQYRSMYASLDVACDAEPVFEADDGAPIEREQIGSLVTEAAAPQIRGKAVRQPKIAAVTRDRHRGRQIDEIEVDLNRPKGRDGNVLTRCRGR